MTPETEVIFQNDGSVILQTDGGYATTLKTPVSAAWESVRSICGSDPDTGWKGHDPQCRKDVDSSNFRAQNVEIFSNYKQRFWFPTAASEAARQCWSAYWQAYNCLISAPQPLLVACEKGEGKVVRRYLRELSSEAVFGFFNIVNSMAFSAEVKLAAVQEFMERPPAPQQAQPVRSVPEAVR